MSGRERPGTTTTTTEEDMAIYLFSEKFNEVAFESALDAYYEAKFADYYEEEEEEEGEEELSAAFAAESRFAFYEVN
jgi:hypothetical protein